MESDENDLDNLFEEQGTEEGLNREETAENNEVDAKNANENQTSERVPVPKRIVKNPRLKFNADRLIGERGIPVLINHFKDVKFKGKGYEVEDLNKLMSALQHWCHRLYPSMTFGDCLRQIEKLGKKRPVQTCLRKIRLDMPILHSDFVRDEEDENPDNKEEELDVEIPPQDAFDRLLNETGNNDYMQLASTPLPASRQAPGQALGTSFGSTLTEEQRKRMEYNKLLATERRKAKLLSDQSTAASSQSENGNTRIMNPDVEVVDGSSTETPALSDSHLLTSQPSSVSNNHAEELELDDLVDLVDEDDETQAMEDEREVSTTYEKEKNNKKVEVIDLANSNYSGHAGKGDTGISSSASHKPIEVVDLEKPNNKGKEIIDLDNAKSVNSKNNNLELIDIDSEGELTPPAKKFKKHEVTSGEQTDVLYVDLCEADNTGALKGEETHKAESPSEINGITDEVMRE